MSAELRHSLLGEQHAFGARQGAAPAGIARPIQVHGTRVVCADSGDSELGEADEDRESYLVLPALWQALPEEITLTLLITSITRQGAVFLWPI